MAPPKKKEWRTEEEKERRRENHLAENERNSHNQALKRANDTVMAKLQSERVKYPRPTELDDGVKHCALVTAMEDGRLDFLKHYRMKNKAFLVNLLFEYTDPHVRAIRDVLSVYGDDLTGDEDGFDEIQTSLNDCEDGFLGEFSNENLLFSLFTHFQFFYIYAIN